MINKQSGAGSLGVLWLLVEHLVCTGAGAWHGRWSLARGRRRLGQRGRGQRPACGRGAHNGDQGARVAWPELRGCRAAAPLLAGGREAGRWGGDLTQGEGGGDAHRHGDGRPWEGGGGGELALARRHGDGRPREGG